MRLQYVEKDLEVINEIIDEASLAVNEEEVRQILKRRLKGKIGQQAIVARSTRKNNAIRRELIQEACHTARKTREYRPWSEAFICLLILGEGREVENQVQAQFKPKKDLDNLNTASLSYVISLIKYFENRKYQVVDFNSVLVKLINLLFYNACYKALEFLIHSPDFFIDSGSDREGLFLTILRHYFDLIIYDSASMEEKRGYSKTIFGILASLDYIRYRDRLEKVFNNAKSGLQNNSTKDQEEFYQLIEVIYGRLCSRYFIDKARLLQEVFEVEDNDRTHGYKIRVIESQQEALRYFHDIKDPDTISSRVFSNLTYKFNSLRDYFDFYLKENRKERVDDSNIFKAVIQNIRYPNDFEIILERCEFEALRSDGKFDDYTGYLENGFFFNFSDILEEDDRARICYKLLVKYLDMGILLSKCLSVLYQRTKDKRLQNDFFKKSLAAPITDMDKQLIIGYHIVQLPFLSAKKIVEKEINEIRNPKIIESMINKSKDARTALYYFNYAEDNNLEVEDKALYRLINLAEDYRTAQRVFLYLRKHGYPVDERVFAQIVIRIGRQYFNRDLEPLLEEVRSSGLDISYVLGLAIRRTESFTKIKQYLAIEEIEGESLSSKHYLNAIKSVASFKDANRFFWYFVNKGGKPDERFLMWLIRKTRSWQQTRLLLRYIEDQKSFYINDKFLLSIAQNATQSADIKNLIEKYENQNEHGLQDLVWLEAAKRMYYFNQVKKHINKDFLLKTKYKYQGLEILLQKACEIKGKSTKNSARNVALKYVLDLFEEFNLFPSSSVRNILMDHWVHPMKEHKNFFNLTKKIPYDNTFFYLKMKHAKSTNGANKWMGNYLSWVEGNVLNHKVVFEYFKLHKGAIDKSPYFKVIIKYELNVDAYYLQVFFERNNLNIQFMKNRKDNDIYWSKLYKYYKLRNDLRKGDFVTLQLIQYLGYLKMYEFFLFGSGIKIYLPKDLIQREFFRLKQGDFIGGMLKEVKPKYLIRFNSLPYQSISQLFTEDDFAYRKGAGAA